PGYSAYIRSWNGVLASSVASPFCLAFSRPPGLIPQPSRIINITGPAMANLCWVSKDPQAVLSLTIQKPPKIDRIHEVEKSVAGAGLPPHFCGARHSLFSALGRS